MPNFQGGDIVHSDMFLEARTGIIWLGILITSQFGYLLLYNKLSQNVEA
jgi:hypothetical protein